MSSSAQIKKAIEEFVEQPISWTETHVDFIDGRVVTWCLDDEPLPTHTTSVNVRCINDVRRIASLRKQNQALEDRIRALTSPKANTINSEGK